MRAMVDGVSRWPVLSFARACPRRSATSPGVVELPALWAGALDGGSRMAIAIVCANRSSVPGRFACARSRLRLRPLCFAISPHCRCQDSHTTARRPRCAFAHGFAIVCANRPSVAGSGAVAPLLSEHEVQSGIEEGEYEVQRGEAGPEEAKPPTGQAGWADIIGFADPPRSLRKSTGRSREQRQSAQARTAKRPGE